MSTTPGSTRPDGGTGKPEGPATTTAENLEMIGLILFKADANEVDLKSQGVVTEVKAASDDEMIGLMADEIETGSDLFLAAFKADADKLGTLKTSCDKPKAG
jgi:hypothetical protein